ncbi:hypothetical protein [Paenibacillus graminis]|uniref:hypothetical protein n=1 Tax=Paenibacillus graminis TaxID=189425 RepID=UPI0004B57E47|nr:hypothetical protein [Paenibacillus graminis]
MALPSKLELLCEYKAGCICRSYNDREGTLMADLSIDLAGIKSPNPFWLASAPPTNTG